MTLKNKVVFLNKHDNNTSAFKANKILTFKVTIQVQ